MRPSRPAWSLSLRLPHLLVLAAVGALFLFLATPSSSNGPSIVRVLNLGDPHPVQGTVEIQSVIPHANFVSFAEVAVSPAGPKDTTDWTYAGLVDCTGFTHVSFSFVGQLQGLPLRDGDIGIILLPEEKATVAPFREYGELHLAMYAATAATAMDSNTFSWSESGMPLAFPKYRVYFYNSTDRTADVNVFFYLTN